MLVEAMSSYREGRTLMYTCCIRGKCLDADFTFKHWGFYTSFLCTKPLWRKCNIQLKTCFTSNINSLYTRAFWHNLCACCRPADLGLKGTKCSHSEKSGMRGRRRGPPGWHWSSDAPRQGEPLASLKGTIVIFLNAWMDTPFLCLKFWIK